MKRIIKLFITVMAVMPLYLMAANNLEYSAFIKGNVVEQNVKNFGIESIDKLDSISFGKPITLFMISSEMLDKENLLDINKESGQTFIPVIIENSVKLFIIVDKNKRPVSLGYKKLAEELNKISKKYLVDINSIKIFESLDINSYLFSIPNSRSENLTILKEGWDLNRSGLTAVSKTVEYLKSVVKVGK